MTTTTLMDAFLLCQKAARGELGVARIADVVDNAAGAGYIEDASEFGFNNLGSGDLNGLYVWRYGLPGTTDELKRVVSVNKTTRRITVDGPAYVDTGDLDYVLIGINPYKVIAAMQNGHSQMTTRQDLVLTIGGSDLDMEWPNEDYWTGLNGSLATASAFMTVTKEVATAGNKVAGKYVLKMAAAAAADLVGPAVRCVPGETLKVVPVLRVVAGGGAWTVQLYDYTHSVAFRLFARLQRL